jgi:hypothetical protein
MLQLKLAEPEEEPVHDCLIKPGKKPKKVPE